MLMLKRTLIILLSAVAVILFSLPLAQTEWADNIRTGPATDLKGKRGISKTVQLFGFQENLLRGRHESDEPGEQRRSGTGTLRYVMPFVKSLVMMGIPALLTICTVRTGRRLFRLRSQKLARGGVTTRRPD